MYNLLQGKVPLDVIHLIQSVHNTHRGHLGIDATCNAVKQANDNKGIHNLKQLVKLYIQACPVCISSRSLHKSRHPLSEGFSVYSCHGPFKDISCDFLTGFSVASNGCDRIFVIVDSFTRYVAAYACSDEMLKRPSAASSYSPVLSVTPVTCVPAVAPPLSVTP